MAGPGRDQVTPMRRLVRIMAVLDKAGAPGASAAQRLIEVAEYGEKDPATQLGKDLKRLRQQGWQIDNVAGRASRRLPDGGGRQPAAAQAHARAAGGSAACGDPVQAGGHRRAARPGHRGAPRRQPRHADAGTSRRPAACADPV